MKKGLVLGLMAALAVCSCQLKEEGEFAPEGKVFTATMEAMVDDAPDIGTKTSMDANGNVRWKRGDQVSIFVGSTINQHFQVTDASDGKTAAALNQVESPGFVAGSEIVNNVAFYPYAATAEIAKSGNSYIISDIALPATQYYATASFGNGAFPMTAVTSSKSDYNLKFKNVLGGLKLQLKGTGTIASISVTGNNNEKLCGAAEVTVSGDNAPAITLTDASAKTVTLDCGDGVQLDANTATAFIIALPPMTMSGGFTVTVTDSQNKQMEIKTTRSQTITRSNLLSMPAVTYEGVESGANPDTMSEEAIDLGLPSGLKWARCNLSENGFVGSPEQPGDYYAWGELEPFYTSGHSMDDPCYYWKEGKVDGYSPTSGKYWISGDSSDNFKFSKYVSDVGRGTVDNKIVLELNDDVAHIKLGGSWRLPTDSEWVELIENCTWTIATQNGMSGKTVTGPNGNSIFIPYAGFRVGNNLLGFGSDGGRYLTSTLLYTYEARCAFIGSGSIYIGSGYRGWGFSVRPVTDSGVRIPVESISLNQSSITQIIQDHDTLTATITPINATQPNVIWTTSNSSIATVDKNGVVTAVSKGSATITATTYDGGFTATCTVTVEELVPEAIDLGLPSGLKWANCNVCATGFVSYLGAYGDYFAWGETEPYYSSWSPLVWKEGKSNGYSWGSYKYGDGYAFSKYFTNDDYGEPDNLKTLELTDDAAYVNCGSSWRMPTDAEWTELVENCTWTQAERSERSGMLVTGPNGNSIFLPEAGCMSGTLGGGGGCYYWSSSLNSDMSAWLYECSSTAPVISVDRRSRARFFGATIRPVTGKGIRVSVTGVSLNKSHLELVEGGTASLRATVTPSNATHPGVIWSSSNTSVATVSWEGVVTAIAPGSATITATTYDGGFTATCSVTVNAASYVSDFTEFQIYNKKFDGTNTWSVYDATASIRRVFYARPINNNFNETDAEVKAVMGNPDDSDLLPNIELAYYETIDLDDYVQAAGLRSGENWTNLPEGISYKFGLVNSWVATDGADQQKYVNFNEVTGVLKVKDEYGVSALNRTPLLKVQVLYEGQALAEAYIKVRIVYSL